jgi:hypothetical protein
MRDLVRRNSDLVLTVIVLLGVLAVLGGAALREESSFWGSAAMSLGVTVAATDLVVLLHRFFRMPVEATGQTPLDALGIVDAHTTPRDETFFQRWARAHAIDLMYCSGRVALERYKPYLLQAFEQRGGQCTLRVLIAKPNGTMIDDPINKDALCPNTPISEDVLTATRWLEELVSDLRVHGVTAGSIEGRYYESSPTCSVAIVDNHLARYTPYLPYLHSANAPSFDVENYTGGLFHLLRKSFDDVWKQSSAHPFVREDLSQPQPQLANVKAAVGGSINTPVP